MSDHKSGEAYWAANINLVRICLVIWAVVSFGFAILFRPFLSGVGIGGSDLAFWFAQQGAIYVYLALIFGYAWRMNKIDEEFGVEEE